MSQPGHLNGLHHVIAITGDARRNLDVYTGVLGLRLVAKSVNQDDPRAYHLYYGDERGTPGAVISFFEYARAISGRAGAGMVHRIAWLVASAAALNFWAERLAGAGICIDRRPERLLFADPDGLGHELVADVGADAPLVASHPEIPAQLALQGLSGIRAYASQPELTGRVLADVLGGARRGPARWELRGSRRGGWIAFEKAPSEPAVRGAGTVHHVAFALTPRRTRTGRRGCTRSACPPLASSTATSSGPSTSASPAGLDRRRPTRVRARSAAPHAAALAGGPAAGDRVAPHPASQSTR